MSSEMRKKHAETLKAVRSVFDGIPAPCAERDALDFAITLLARTEAGADGDDLAKRLEHAADYEGESGGWDETIALLREAANRVRTHPQDASGDAESTALYLRPYDVTMIGQAKHAGQDMVSVLAHLHPTEGWDVRFNAAMQAKEAK